MTQYVRKYLLLILIIFFSVIISVIGSIIISGSRTTGIGYGLNIGIYLGNLVFALLQKGGLIRKIAAWLLSSAIISACTYVILNYTSIDNTLLLILAAYVIPTILSWEITRRAVLSIC